MNIISIPIIGIASISFYVSLYHLLIYLRRKQHRQDLTFAILCFVNGIYDILCAGLYNVESVAEGVRWQRMQFITLAFFDIAFLWFVADYIRQKSYKVTYIFSAYYFGDKD